MNNDSFASNCRFYDTINFPHGFHRAGVFTRTEAELLTRCGHVIKQLSEQQLKPENAEQQHMLDVLEGAEEPTTVLEKAWVKYLRVTQAKRQFRYSNLAGVTSDHGYYDEQGW